ncbi:MAG: hypothetical protein KIC47_09070, partial [Clostridium sp.]|nr:hypothetical protein [Clostridium sp.]
MKRFKIFKQLKEYLDKNIIFKVSICIILVVMLVAVLILGSIYSNNLNKRNLSLVVTKSNDEDLTNKQEEEKRKAEEKKKEEEKKVKLQELKDKIKELDENADLTITEEDIDKDILYYENIYNELLKEAEENEEGSSESNESENTYDPGYNNDNSNGWGQ